MQQFNWEVVERGANAVLGEEQYVSVRKNCLKMSVGFEAAAGVQESNYSFVRVRRDNIQQCLLFEFFTEGQIADMRVNDVPLHGIYPLLLDGGHHRRRAGPRVGGAVINCGTVILHTPWLRAVLRETQAQARRFVPQKTDRINAWVIRFLPTFEIEDNFQGCSAKTGVLGIYRFLDENRHELYIGQGKVLERYTWHKQAKAEMKFAFFQWTPVSNLAKRLKAESHYLEKFLLQHGRRPIWNKIMGHSPAAIEELCLQQEQDHEKV